MPLALSSPAFSHGGEIHRKYTCEGQDVSPPLAWSGAPNGTKSFALVVDDPDAPDPRAPRMRWVHWVLYNLPSTITELPEGVMLEALPTGTKEGQNDSKRTGYGGPARRSGATAIFISCMRSIRSCQISGRRPGRSSSRRWRDTYWRAPS